jgi:hypothetical protein
MQRTIRPAILALVCILFLSACNSVPKHVRYIPKDASIVVGINIKEIGKSLAWSAITGSKLLDEMKANVRDTARGKSIIDGIENSGIDWMNTVYCYAKPDKRFSNDLKTGLVAPMSDVKAWEAYVNKIAPGIAINKVKDRSEAMFDGKVYAAWNSDVLIVMNTAVQDIVHEEEVTVAEPIADDAAATEPVADMADMPTYKWRERVTDTAATLAEMEAAFMITKDASIMDNDRFKKLDKEGNDISVFVAYDGMLNNMSQKTLGMGFDAMMMTASLWKNAAMTTAVNFEDGKITADMRYYPSDSMKRIASEAGNESIDKDMLSRIPEQQLNMAAGYHLSPKVLKMVLDQLNLTGMANLALMESGTNVDEILGAFTGDMVLSLNEFAVNKVTNTPDSALAAMYGADEMKSYDEYKPQMNLVYALKVNDHSKLEKLLALVQKQTGLAPSAPGVYQIPMGGNESVNILINDKFIVVSNKAASALAYQKGNNGSIPAILNKEIAGHPTGMYVDIKSMLAALDGNMFGNREDEAILKEVRNLLLSLKMNGGEFKGEANEYHAELNFVNKSENSLVQLLNFAQRVSALQKGNEVVKR